MNSIFDSRLRYLPFFIVVIVAFILIRNNPYFWDTIQFGSQHADWYFTNKFRYFFLPEKFDSGHPPFFGMYIAFCWVLFGKSLVISHFAMLPFALGSVFLLFKMGDYFLGREKSVFFVLLCFADPTLTAQHVLVSPDVPLVFFMLMCLYGIFYNKRWILMIGAIGLAGISMRGMVLVAAFYVYEQVFDFYLNRNQSFKLKPILTRIMAYIPAGLVGITFLIAHHIATGWTGHHANSPWAGCFEKVNAIGMIKNVAIAGFRFLEFGRIGVLIGLVVFMMLGYKKDNKINQLVILLCIVSTFIILPQLPYKVLLGSRYLLPISLLLSLCCCSLLFSSTYLKESKKVVAWIFIAFCLFGGNFWTYPKTIAMSWDATLAHLNYFEPRSKMFDYINQQKIPYTSIGSSFPENEEGYYTDLSDRRDFFGFYDFRKNEYIFYSNVINDFSDEELDELEKSWINIQSYKKGNVEVILYKRPNR
jgi:hypothetical protein